MHASSPSPDSSQLPEREALATVHVKNLTSSAPLSSSSSSSSSGLLALTPSASCSSGSRSNSRTESPVSTEETRATSWWNCQPGRRMRLTFSSFWLKPHLYSICTSTRLYCLINILLVFPCIAETHCTFSFLPSFLFYSLLQHSRSSFLYFSFKAYFLIIEKWIPQITNCSPSMSSFTGHKNISSSGRTMQKQKEADWLFWPYCLMSLILWLNWNLKHFLLKFICLLKE